MDKYRVMLDALERTALEQLVSTGKSASRRLTHARVLLLADTKQGGGHSDDDILTALGVSSKTISRVGSANVGISTRVLSGILDRITPGA